jgi:hypothetical protein
MITLTIDTKDRSAVLGGNASFAAGENKTVKLSGVRDPDLQTLVLCLYDDESGAKLCQASGFAAESETSVDTWVAELSTYTDAITSAFSGKVPGTTLTSVLCISDASAEYVNQKAELRSNPNSIPGTEPVPETWVTLLLLEEKISDHNSDAEAHPALVRHSAFADIVLPEFPTQRQVADALREVLVGLKGT